MFFANRENGLPLEQCPDNDGHNVDTLDGLVNLAPVIFAAHGGAKQAVDSAVSDTLSLFRRSNVLVCRAAADFAAAHAIEIQRKSTSYPLFLSKQPQFGSLYASMLSSLLAGADLRSTVASAGKAVGYDASNAMRARDPMTA
eukprot:SAG31_NODE_343_length_17426_cov_35.294443_18_plen_142_part_00